MWGGETSKIGHTTSENAGGNGEQMGVAGGIEESDKRLLDSRM